MKNLFKHFLSDSFQLGLAMLFLTLMFLSDAIYCFKEGRTLIGLLDIALAVSFQFDYWKRWRHKIK